MPVVRPGSQPAIRNDSDVRLPAGSRWRRSPSLDQARVGSAFLRRGQAGASVAQVQRLLNAAGARPPLDEDGLFGPLTLTAVRRFQAQHGLSQDGIVGPQTLGALESGGATLDARGSSGRRERDLTGSDAGLGRAAERAPGLGAEAQPRTTGAFGVLSARGRLDRSDIDWSHPRVRPAGGRVTRPSAEAFAAAVNAYEHARQKGQVRNHKLTLVDYSLPSNQARMWVIDMDSRKLLTQQLVAHGSGSGSPRDARMATSFSDRGGSHKSSLGTFITAETYHGEHGYSLRLDGKEPGFNSNARARTIVMHPADYVDEDFVRPFGYAGRSWGCLAMDPDTSRAVIDMVKGGSVVLAYANDPAFLRGSAYIRAAG